jgi:hypothetical protein
MTTPTIIIGTMSGNELEWIYNGITHAAWGEFYFDGEHYVHEVRTEDGQLLYTVIA